MPASDAAVDLEALAYFSERFGIPEAFLTSLRFEDRGDEIWVATPCDWKGLYARRPAGLRALRRAPDGLKPTSTILTLWGDQITRSRVDLSLDSLVRLLLGRRLDVPGSDGYVALATGRDVIGCGRIRKGQLQSLVSTGRRRELLDVLGR